MGLKISLAGRVSIDADGVLIDEERFPGRQGRLVFAHLVSEHGRPVLRDELAESLWAGVPPATWEKALGVIASKLRVLLGECGLDGAQMLTSAFGCYHLELPEGSWVDVLAAAQEMDEAEAALARGRPELAKARASKAAAVARLPLLSGEERAWVEGKRRELGDVLERALNCLADACLRSGHASEAAKWAQEAIVLQPFRESGYRRLMHAHAAAGNRAEALQAYERCRRLLADELGAYPSPETESTNRELLSAAPDETRAPAVPENGDATAAAAAAAADTAPARMPRRRRWLRRRVIAAATLGAVTSGVALGLLLAHVFGPGGGTADVNSMLAPDAIGAINPNTGAITAQLPVAGTPTRLATNGRDLWVGSDDSTTLAEVSLNTRSVSTSLQAGGFPSAFGIGAGSLWVLDGRRGLLAHVNPSYGGVVTRTRIGVGDPLYDITRLSVDPTSVAVGSASVWTTDGSQMLARIDPATGRLLNTFDLGTALDGVSAGAGSVWTISGESATALRVNRRGAVTARVSIVSKPNFASPYPMQVRIGAGYVWVLNANTATVTKIDPEQRSVAATIPIGIDRHPVRLAVGSRFAWVANGDGTLSRIDAATDGVKTIPVGHNLRDVAVAGGTVWAIAGRGLSGGAGQSQSPSGVGVRALPTSSCSPIYYGGVGHPQYLIASDLPLQNFGTTIGQMSQAIQFVLRERGFRAGRYAVGYQSCDDSSPDGDVSEARCAANAGAYADNASVVGVVGAFVSDCSAIEIPILNRAPHGPLAMISPTNTVVGLTRAGSGTSPGEPDLYYPRGIRNYARVVANDDAQGAADALLASELGLRKVFVLHDSNGYGYGLAAVFARVAAELKVKIAGNQSFNYGLSSYSPLVAQVAAARPDALLMVGGISPDTAELLKELRAVLGPRVQILATDGFSLFPVLRKLAGAAAEGMLVSEAGVPNSELPTAGRTFVAAFAKAVDETPASYPAYTAQAAEVLLDAIARSNGTRASVTAELFKTKVSNGILGTFAIDRNGDTTAAPISIYRIVDGAPRLLKVITPPPALVR
ncbi:MAG: ABC transporter substrate-binding protein [Gaiellaceae bacterium]